ncbi:MAG: 6-phosphofructokinase [Butyricicoccaceae bacterium]
MLTLGGTILGTSRQPLEADAAPRGEDSASRPDWDKMLKTVKKAGFDCLVILGGNGTHKTANLLRENGVNVVTLPETIDNDLWGRSPDLRLPVGGEHRLRRSSTPSIRPLFPTRACSSSRSWATRPAG